jgi:phosphoribosylanthranilate isomerase
MSVKVKICGLTNLADAQAAVDAGADMVGFVFAEESPRRVPIETAAEISRALPVHIVKVGVFVNASDEFVAEAARECSLGLLQFHGDENSWFCTQFGIMSMKAFRMRDEKSLEDLLNFSTDAWLLDAYVDGERGGSGKTFNWHLAVAAQKFGKPIFLAGGLNPENVAQAVRQVRPFAVDVSTGVESSPGKKDHARIKAFIRAARPD